MKIVLQKVNNCTLYSETSKHASIGYGLLILVGVHRVDQEAHVEYLAKKISHLRVFKDENNKINKSILDIGGDALVVSNFTLQAEIKSGTRPSFSNGSDEKKAEQLYLLLAKKLAECGVKNVATGVFKTHMHLDVSLDGPFTIILEK